MHIVSSTLNHLSFPTHDVAAVSGFFEHYLGFTATPLGRSAVLKKDGWDIVIEEALDRDTTWPGNFHIGVEVQSPEDLAALYRQMLADGVRMQTELFAHPRGSRFFCWVPEGPLVEVNTRADAAPEFRRSFASQRP